MAPKKRYAKKKAAPAGGVDAAAPGDVVEATNTQKPVQNLVPMQKKEAPSTVTTKETTHPTSPQPAEKTENTNTTNPSPKKKNNKSKNSTTPRKEEAKKEEVKPAANGATNLKTPEEPATTTADVTPNATPRKKRNRNKKKKNDDENSKEESNSASVESKPVETVITENDLKRDENKKSAEDEKTAEEILASKGYINMKSEQETADFHAFTQSLKKYKQEHGDPETKQPPTKGTMAETKENKMSTSDRFAEVNQMKGEGNQFFKLEVHEMAAACYSKALDKLDEIRENSKLHDDKECNELMSKLYGNRSNAFYQLNQFENSLHDAEASIKLDAANLKAYLKAGQCCLKLNRADEAEFFAKSGLEKQGNNVALLELKRKIQHHGAIIELKNKLCFANGMGEWECKMGPLNQNWKFNMDDSCTMVMMKQEMKQTYEILANGNMKISPPAEVSSPAVEYSVEFSNNNELVMTNVSNKKMQLTLKPKAVDSSSSEKSSSKDSSKLYTRQDICEAFCKILPDPSKSNYSSFSAGEAMTITNDIMEVKNRCASVELFNSVYEELKNSANKSEEAVLKVQAFGNFIHDTRLNAEKESKRIQAEVEKAEEERLRKEEEAKENANKQAADMKLKMELEKEAKEQAVNNKKEEDRKAVEERMRSEQRKAEEQARKLAAENEAKAAKEKSARAPVKLQIEQTVDITTTFEKENTGTSLFTEESGNKVCHSLSGASTTAPAPVETTGLFVSNSGASESPAMSLMAPADKPAFNKDSFLSSLDNNSTKTGSCKDKACCKSPKMAVAKKPESCWAGLAKMCGM